MLKLCLRFVLAFPLVIVSFLFLSTPVHAARTITSATLNGSSSVTVAPSASITAQINVTTDAVGGPQWWSTSWNTGSGATCVNHDNHSIVGSFSESFAITAPSSDGTYNVSFIAYLDDGCSSGASSTYTLTGGIIVSSSTPTPTPTATPGPTSTPGATATPTSAPSSTSTATVVFPSINLSRQGLLFSGTASITEGVIESVEYSLDEGHSWQKASAKDGKFDENSEEYTFSPKGIFSVGEHKVMTKAKSLAQVYTQSSSYASVTFTVSAPKVTLDEISPNPTKDQTPTITGTASSDFVTISSVQISLDEGKSWFPAKLINNKFRLVTKFLEDGNYPVRARVFDSAGNTSESETQILIVDTIPPIIGGNVTALGSQILTPDSTGMIRTVAGAENMIVMSMRGGVTKATLNVEDEGFDLTPIEDTHLWNGKIIFDKNGERPTKIIAVDGAGNTTERALNPFLIEESGQVINTEDNLPIKDAQVSLYLFETTTESWMLWDGSSFGQKNPQQTNEDGSYNYIVPAGRYYLEVQARGFRTMQSEIFDLSETATLVATFPLSSKPKITIQLPILGELNFTIPFPYPAQTLRKNELFKESQAELLFNYGLKKGVELPDFSLPNPQGKITSPSDFEGQDFVLTFLSTWTPPSVEQALILNQANQTLNEKQAILTVFLQDSSGEVETFLKRGKYDFKAVIDNDGLTSSDYQISALPQHFFVNSEGVISDTFTGVLGKKELLEKLESLD